MNEKEQRFAGFLCDLVSPMTLTPGIYPNTCVVRTTSDHYEEETLGDLELRVGNTEVKIEMLFVVGSRRTTEFVNGSATGRSIIELTLADRRLGWKFGSITGGPFNVRTEDGMEIVEGTEKTLNELIDLCLAGMGETGIDVPESDATAYDVEWAFDNPAECLQQLLDAGNMVVCLNADATISIHEKGCDCGEPSIPEGMKEKTSPTISDSGAPDTVIVTSAPSRVINEITVENWVPVGVEEDETIVPIDELLYTPACGWLVAAAWEFNVPDPVQSEVGACDLTDDQRKLAERCIGKWFRIPENWKDRLPILEQRVWMEDDKPLPPLVEAATFRQEFGGGLKNFSKGEVSEGYSIDNRRGIVQFNHIVGSVANTNHTALFWAGIAAFGPVDVTFAYERKEGDIDDYYWKLFERSGADGSWTQVVKVPKLVLLQIDGEGWNLSELNEAAATIAAPILDQGNTVSERQQKCKGCWNVELNGSVTSVTWDGNVTVYTVNHGLPPFDATGLAEKEMMARIQADRSASSGHRQIEERATGLGSGDRARSGGGLITVVPELPPRANLWKKVSGDDEGPFTVIRIDQEGTEIGESITDVYPLPDATVADDTPGRLECDANGRLLFFCSSGELKFLSFSSGIEVSSDGFQWGGSRRTRCSATTGHRSSLYLGDGTRLATGIAIVVASVDISWQFSPGWMTPELAGIECTLGSIYEEWDPLTLSWATRPGSSQGGNLGGLTYMHGFAACFSANADATYGFCLEIETAIQDHPDAIIFGILSGGTPYVCAWLIP